MKKTLISILCIILFIIVSCNNKPQEYYLSEEKMRNLSELAVFDCFYHSTAKVHKDSDGLLKTEKTMWYDFTATLKLGIDASKISIEQPITESKNEKTVIIKLPPIKQIGKVNILSDTIEHISSNDSWRAASISTNEITEAIEMAKKEVEEELMQDSGLKTNAEKRVKEILKSYIYQIGDLSGISYNIVWEKIESETSQKI